MGSQVARLVLALCLLATTASATNKGQWGEIDPATRDWFKSIRNSSGVMCCSIADGYPTDWRIVDKHYEVFIEGEWEEVPEAAVVRVPNPLGRAVTWYNRYGVGKTSLLIRCFVPATEG